MPSTLDAKIRSLVSVAAMADKTGHSVMCVYRALDRLGVEPEVTAPFRLYRPETIAKLRASMRAPRRRRANPSDV